MTKTAQAYPLSWPQSFPRSRVREKGTFKTTLHKAHQNVVGSLNLFARDSGKKISPPILSSNVTLGANRPEDPGVAIWFTWDGLSVCFAVDRYSTVEANLQAIHHIIEARRTELRHGTLALVRASLQGFKALPAPAGQMSWRTVLGLPDGFKHPPGVLDAARRKLLAEYHPDKPTGDRKKFDQVSDAYQEAKKELGYA